MIVIDRIFLLSRYVTLLHQSFELIQNQMEGFQLAALYLNFIYFNFRLSYFY